MRGRSTNIANFALVTLLGATLSMNVNGKIPITSHYVPMKHELNAHDQAIW